LQAGEISYRPWLPSPCDGPVLDYGFRSCLPLRGSSGFAPDSLFGLNASGIGNGGKLSQDFGIRQFAAL